LPPACAIRKWKARSASIAAASSRAVRCASHAASSARRCAGLARERALEQVARGLELAHAVGARQELAHRAGQLADHPRGGRPGDRRALAGRELDQPHLAQREQRLAHRAAAGAELRHQLALGRQPVARRDAPGEHRVLDRAGDRLVAAGGGHGGLHHRRF
jgi:hypothetical protein